MVRTLTATIKFALFILAVPLGFGSFGARVREERVWKLLGRFIVVYMYLVLVARKGLLGGRTSNNFRIIWNRRRGGFLDVREVNDFRFLRDRSRSFDGRMDIYHFWLFWVIVSRISPL